MFRVLIPIILALSVGGCSSHSSDRKKNDVLGDSSGLDDGSDAGSKPTGQISSELENKMIARLWKLPEIESAHQHIDSFSEHTHGITFMFGLLSPDSHDVPVQAGYSGDNRFEVYYNLYVDTGNLQVKIEDIYEGDVVDMEIWRNREKLRNEKPKEDKKAGEIELKLSE